MPVLSLAILNHPNFTVQDGLLQDDIRLTPTSLIVLGLLEAAGEATPYDLKGMVQASVGNFWTLQHAQVYSEPERLAAAGYLREQRERGGRRRRRYRLTAKGRSALDRWRAEPSAGLTELRDPGLLQLFFGADRPKLAKVQLEAHQQRLDQYLELKRQDPGTEPRGRWLALEAGIGHAREWVRFWKRVGQS
jgi:PadR family transcriptional regulator AphA